LEYNNIIVGDENNVTGNSNVVIGSRNSFNGTDGWVFASDYKSNNHLEGVLIIGNYLIELDEIMVIGYRPREAIHCLKKGDSNKHSKKLWDTCKIRRRTTL